nr:hypothetical protein [Yersinia pseudotuberculosis]
MWFKKGHFLRVNVRIIARAEAFISKDVVKLRFFRAAALTVYNPP